MKRPLATMLAALLAFAGSTMQAVRIIPRQTAAPGRPLSDVPALHAPKLASIARFIPAVDWTWANHGQSLRLLNRLLGVLLDRVHLGLVAPPPSTPARSL